MLTRLGSSSFQFAVRNSQFQNARSVWVYLAWSVSRLFRNGYQVLLWGLICFFTIAPSTAIAGPLRDRVAAYPQWQGRPPVTAAQGDLVYPDWFAGTWQVESPLVEAIAPLAPEIITPGFEAQKDQLDQVVTFQVRFSPQVLQLQGGVALSPPQQLRPQVVADRAFNGREIAQAYLGSAVVRSVKVEPHQPNRQITQLNPSGQLIATVTDRSHETPDATHFIATELTNQVFRLGEQVYVNDVETTTAYEQVNNSHITANQITAIYLSPQDPAYFQAGDRPVALYRYALTLQRLVQE